MRAGIAVVGDGPAGWALAVACAEADLPVVLIGSDPERVWPATYGAWVDELDGGAGPGSVPWRHRYADPQVAFDGVAPTGVARPFGVLDNAALHEHLRARFAAAGGSVRSGTVRAASHDGQGSVVALGDGASLGAALVVDATGHRPALATPGTGRAPGWQVAYGIVARIRRPPVPPGGMRFMDWRTDGQPRDAAPTFLYAMDFGGGLTFVEETSLAARPALPMATLQARLERRLAAHGATVEAVEAVERVAFPMGVPVPPRQPVAAYGAAAGMAPPAPGLRLPAALRPAPQVAAAIAAAHAAPDARPEALAEAAWDAVWPADLLHQRALHAYGLEALLGMGSRDVQRFFRAFFALPPEAWHAYLSGAGSSRELALIMLAVVRRLPPRLALRVSSGAFGVDGLALVRAALARP